MAGRLLTPEPRPPCMHQQTVSTSCNKAQEPTTRSEGSEGCLLNQHASMGSSYVLQQMVQQLYLLLTSALELPRAPRPLSPRLSPELVRGALLPPRPASTGTPPEGARSAPAAHGGLRSPVATLHRQQKHLMTSAAVHIGLANTRHAWAGTVACMQSSAQALPMATRSSYLVQLAVSMMLAKLCAHAVL